MARDAAYQEAEKKIEEARRSGAVELNLARMGLTELPESLSKLTQLRALRLNDNKLTALPESLSQLTQLEQLDLYGNHLNELPNSLGELQQLRQLWVGLSVSGNPICEIPPFIRRLRLLEVLDVSQSQVDSVPEWVGELSCLTDLYLNPSRVSELPVTLLNLPKLKTLNLDGSPLNPELAAAYKQGLAAVKGYLRAKSEAQIVLNEAKLILVGEGEVGKSCLLGALRGDPWEEGRPTTHGIEIKPVKVTDPESGTEITLNGWDFGGQKVYRPTHQLFFSAPAVYLVVWKPREGPEQGFVKDWIRLVKHREPEAKILVVATHGGPGQRQPDLDRQEFWEMFGRDTVLDFYHVDSKPDEKKERRGVAELKDAVARVAAGLPEMGRTVPARWQQAREDLKSTGAPYLPLDGVLEICRGRGMDEEEARLFVSISHRLGHLIHYEHDPTLRDIVVLKPDWLATAISFVLDDKETRERHGLVDFAKLSQLWNDPARPEEFRYDPSLHPIFLRLMERFDLSYKVALPSDATDEIGFWQRVGSASRKAFLTPTEVAQLHYTSLIAQLVPDVRPEEDLSRVWPPDPMNGDEQQVQICRIVDAKSGQSATAEGLFYQLIVRLHKFSLGRADYGESVHWQRGLVLDNDYNGRALLEHVGNDIRITVRAPYPERFLSALTYEAKWLVENFWEGLRCDVMVPCIEPCGQRAPGAGLYEVRKLIESKRGGRPEYPCPVCSEWQEIDCLLRNAPAARPMPAAELLAGFAEVKRELVVVRRQLRGQHRATVRRFDNLDASTQAILSKVDDAFSGLLQALTDEAKDGPRLFSLVPVNRALFNPKKWMSEKFRLTLWCEHSRLPLPALDEKEGRDGSRGVYEIELKREWVKKAAPFLKVLGSTLSLALPVASSALKISLDDAAFEAIEDELDFGNACIDATVEGGEKVGQWLGGDDAPKLGHGEAIRAQGVTLRELHALLKKQDPGFGGLVRVQNKRQEFLWVHPQFEKEY